MELLFFAIKGRTRCIIYSKVSWVILKSSFHLISCRSGLFQRSRNQNSLLLCAQVLKSLTFNSLAVTSAKFLIDIFLLKKSFIKIIKKSNFLLSSILYAQYFILENFKVTTDFLHFTHFFLLLKILRLKIAPC